MRNEPRSLLRSRGPAFLDEPVHFCERFAVQDFAAARPAFAAELRRRASESMIAGEPGNGRKVVDQARDQVLDDLRSRLTGCRFAGRGCPLIGDSGCAGCHRQPRASICAANNFSRRFASMFLVSWFLILD